MTDPFVHPRKNIMLDFYSHFDVLEFPSLDDGVAYAKEHNYTGEVELIHLIEGLDNHNIAIAIYNAAITVGAFVWNTTKTDCMMVHKFSGGVWSIVIEKETEGGKT